MNIGRYKLTVRKVFSILPAKASDHVATMMHERALVHYLIAETYINNGRFNQEAPAFQNYACLLCCIYVIHSIYRCTFPPTSSHLLCFFFSLLPSRNSDPGSYSRLFSPLPTTSLLDLRRTVLTHARQSQQLLIIIFFANNFKISPQRDSNSRTNTIYRGIRGLPLLIHHRSERSVRANSTYMRYPRYLPNKEPFDILDPCTPFSKRVTCRNLGLAAFSGCHMSINDEKMCHLRISMRKYAPGMLPPSIVGIGIALAT